MRNVQYQKSLLKSKRSSEGDSEGRYRQNDLFLQERTAVFKRNAKGKKMKGKIIHEQVKVTLLIDKG
ncbi:CLUMA_CG000314, isoform A [Clunio marinus]|uniref:CLUMA_CG000314, isoform A n=1 Tax=Clunio marinus TaxID=568069 RepID=A0A1J1HEU1_9DIPT|nr:CLUMA_CG000314, isoform A [Clunio marinus]